MTARVLIVGEQDAGHLAPVALEAVTVAHRLAGPGAAAGFVAGGGSAEAAAAFARAGIGRVLAADDPRYDRAPPAALARAVAAAAEAVGATAVLLGGTTFGRDLAGPLAIAFRAAAANGVTEVEADGDVLRVKRPVFGGRATETRRLEGGRYVLTFRPHAFPASEGPGASLQLEPLANAPPPPSSPLPERKGVAAVAGGTGPALSDAAIVVSGGRGVRAPENFHLIEELAGALGAAVGASRAVTDAGWRPNALQVGQTGKTVAPQLYLAVGISGAIQHLVGMVSSRVIVAINNDPTAPIFKVADYGIAGDLFEIVPALTVEVRKARGLG